MGFGFVVATKWLFDDYATPLAVFFLRQSSVAELLNAGRKETGSRGEVIEVAAPGAVFFVGFGERVFEILESGRIGEIALHVFDALVEPVPGRVVDLGGGELADVLALRVAEFLAGEFVAGKSDQREFIRK